MATVNSTGNSLTGITGTGTFVGANTPTLITPALGSASATRVAIAGTDPAIVPSVVGLIATAGTGGTGQTIAVSGGSANVTFYGQVITVSGLNSASDAIGQQINTTTGSGVPINTGLDVNAIVQRASGSSARSYHGIYSKVTTLTSASTATNMAYYGVRGVVTDTYTGETSTVTGVSGEATGPSTVYGVYASASGGGVANYGIYSASGTNYFAGATTFNAAITPAQVAGIVGTTTNNNSAAGTVGEFVSSVISDASSVSLSTGAVSNITTISLTAGDWDVWGNVVFYGGSTTNVIQFIGWSSNTSATAPNSSLEALLSYPVAGVVPFISGAVGFAVPFRRVSVATTTTVYLSVLSYFTVSTCVGYGGIFARRAR